MLRTLRRRLWQALDVDIFLDKTPSADDLRPLFDDGRGISIIGAWEESGSMSSGDHQVVIAMNESEFPVGVEFQRRPTGDEEWLLEAARHLSVALRCRSIYSGSPLGDATPWDVIVFDRGRAFMGDNCGTKVANEGDKPVSLGDRLPALDAIFV